jgi:hypothetical protein
MNFMTEHFVFQRLPLGVVLSLFTVGPFFENEGGEAMADHRYTDNMQLSEWHIQWDTKTYAIYI